MTLCRQLGAIGLLIVVRPVHAETLYDAITMACETNPALQAQRADLRAAGEDLEQARDAFGPSVTLSGQLAYDAARVDQPASIFSGPSVQRYRAKTASADVALVEPLYSSGALSAHQTGATSNLSAAQQGLRRVEGRLILEVIAAYEDVRRDRDVVTILETEIASLEGILRENDARKALGQLTKTDVAESAARLIGARAQLLLSRGRLSSSEAAYLGLVGQAPGHLDDEPEFEHLPRSIDDAYDVAEKNNPELMAASALERASRAKIQEARAAYGPTVALKLDGSIAPNDLYLDQQYARSASAAITFSVPLYTSGINRSKERAAIAGNSKADANIDVTKRSVFQTVAQAWDQINANRDAIELYDQQLKANRESLKGNRIEERVGQRRTIDILNAQLELSNTQIAMVQAFHDEYVAEATLINAMGLLEARMLVPDIRQPKGGAHYRHWPVILTNPIEAVAMTVDKVGATLPKPHNARPAARMKAAGLSPAPQTAPETE